MKLESVHSIIHDKLKYLQTKVAHRMIRDKAQDTTMKLFDKTNVFLNIVLPTTIRFIQTENACYWSDNATKIYSTINEQIGVLPMKPTLRDTL